jgi:hypothetical protein
MDEKTNQVRFADPFTILSQAKGKHLVRILFSLWVQRKFIIEVETLLSYSNNRYTCLH